MKRKLIVMVKMPVPGNVKTRLQPFLNADECATFASALLRDTELKANDSDCEPVFAVEPAVEAKSFGRILNGDYRIFGQKGNSLGDRMNKAFSAILEDGGSCAVMIGTDCPFLSRQIIEEAFEVLESGKQVVVGPSGDGGFYLIGLRQPDHLIFKNVEWSTSRVLDQTLSNIRDLGLSVELLVELYDIDEPRQLPDLRKALLKEPSAAPNTSSWFDNNSHLFKTSS